MIASEQINEISLDFVSILVFVDENELKLPAVNFRDPLVLLKQKQSFLKQVVKIHRVRRLFLFLVALPNVLNLLEQRQEIRKLFRKQFLQRVLGIDDETEDFREHIAFRKSDLLWIDSCAGHHSLDQVFLIFAVHDGE